MLFSALNVSAICRRTVADCDVSELSAKAQWPRSITEWPRSADVRTDDRQTDVAVQRRSAVCRLLVVA